MLVPGAQAPAWHHPHRLVAVQPGPNRKPSRLSSLVSSRLPCGSRPPHLLHLSRNLSGRHVQEQEAEPSSELPERLREYSGPSDDRKALVQWRQEQQVGGVEQG